MLNKVLILVLCSLLSGLTAFAQTIVPGGNVSGTWTAAGSPYLVQGNITIQADSTLNIEPGVEVNFQGHYTLTVNGFLQAIGTATDSIHFTASTDWEGITFSNASDSSHLEYCILDSAASFSAPLYCQNSNPVISHCTIRDNSGYSGSGGIQIANSNPRISYCTISNNSGTPSASGGITISGSDPEIYYCTITGNYSAGGEGGGIYCEAGSTPVISHCTITGNSSKNSNGGGIAFVNGGGGTITDCFITADSAYNNGGGIYISSSGGVVNINNSTIKNCNTESYDGGGIYIYQADTVSIVSTVIDANHAFHEGGAMYSVDCSNLFIDHCDVVNNAAQLYEGGIYLNGNTNIIVKNSIFRDQVGPHIMFQSYSSASVTYNDFLTASFNNPPAGLGTLTQTNANGDSCDVFYNTFLDPLFVDFTNGDYHLTGTSPCIDAGDPASLYDPDGTITDMGRYYFDQGGTGIPGGYVSGTWTAAGSPYRILGNITVPVDSTLNIEPGVEVIFYGNYNLYIYGSLQAIGTETDSIYFMPADTTSGWGSIDIQYSSADFSYCSVRFSGTGGVSTIRALDSRINISHCLIGDNKSTGEGGLGVWGSHVTVSNSSIVRNYTSSRGGGIGVRDSSYLSISNSTISYNQNSFFSEPKVGGGIYLTTADTLIVSNCIFSNNIAGPLTGNNSKGGAIGMEPSSGGGYVNILGCTFLNNSADYEGGAIYLNSNTAVLSDNYFRGNSTLIKGSALSLDSSDVQVSHNIFDRNTHLQGGIMNGAVLIGDNSSALFDHCNFYSNGGAFSDKIFVLSGTSSLDMKNTVFSQHPNAFTMQFNSGSVASVEYSNFYNALSHFIGSVPTGLGTISSTNANGDSCDTFHNIFLDPLFADAANGDYHLTWANWPTPDSTKSPCIDAGDPSSPYDPDSTVAVIGAFYFNQLVTENLILNPGCEDSLINGEIPYWTEVLGTGWTQRTAGPDPYEGLAYFFPGVAALAELDQDVDVSAYKSAIDNGNQSFIFEGYVRAWAQNPPDQSRIILEFLDSLKTTKIDSFDSGNYSNTSEWVQIIDTSLAPFGTRYIRIRLISTRNAGSNNDGYYDGLSLVAANLTGIKEVRHNLPESAMLFQNYPNPFNPVTTIRFDLPKSGKVELIVYDILGRKVTTLVNKKMFAGRYEVKWNAVDYPSGLYLYRLTSDRYQSVRKMVLMK